MSNYFLVKKETPLTSLKLTVRTWEGFGSDEFPFGKVLLLGDMISFQELQLEGVHPINGLINPQMRHGWNIYRCHLPVGTSTIWSECTTQKIHGSLDVPGS